MSKIVEIRTLLSTFAESFNKNREMDQRGFQSLRFLSASVLSVWSFYAVEQDWLSHDEIELTDGRT